MSDLELIDQFEASVDALLNLNRPYDFLVGCSELLEEEDTVWIVFTEGDFEKAARFRKSLQQLRRLVVETLELSEFSMRQSEKLLIGGGLAAILFGFTSLFSLSLPIIAILPLVIGTYVGWRGYAEGSRNAKRVAHCKSLLYSIDALLEMR